MSAAGGVWGCGVLFAGVDSVVGANACASAAIDAGIGVDVIDFAFRDSAYGALGEAGAACYTCVGNYVCHNCNFLFGKNIYVVVCWCKFNSFFCISQSLTAKIAMSMSCGGLGDVCLRAVCKGAACKRAPAAGAEDVALIDGVFL